MGVTTGGSMKYRCCPTGKKIHIDSDQAVTCKNIDCPPYTKKLNSHVDLPLIERAKLEGGAAQTLRDAERRNPKKTIGNREGFFDAAIPSAADKKKKGDKKRLVGFGIREAAAEDEENAFAAETHYRNGKRRGVESIMHTSGGGRAGRGRGRGGGRGKFWRL